MTLTPYEALDHLRSMAADGQLDVLCARHDVELLVVHGSVLDPRPLRPAQDLDLAFRYRSGIEPDVLALTNDLLEATQLDSIDLMDLQRAGPVARARALAPQSLVLYEQRPGVFTTAQMGALTTEMETRRLRLLDLQLMAGR